MRRALPARATGPATRSPRRGGDARSGVLAGTLIGALAGSVLAVATAGEMSLEERLAAASPERGREVFQVCRACHVVEEGAGHTVGPNLWGVLGRPVASAKGYDRYTPAMSSSAGIWSAHRMDRYLRQPMREVEGTAMVFPGIADAADRANLIAWLASGPDARLAPGPAPDLGVLVDEEGADVTHAHCAVCHSERLVAQQGLTRADWSELLEEMVEEHGMTPIEEPVLGRILTYLGAHYGPDRPNFLRQ